MVAYDLATGDQLWTYDAKEPVMGTPASFGRLIYAASTSHIHALEPGTGEVVWKRGLLGRTSASPALSASNLYVSTREEFSSLSLTFQIRGHDDDGSGGLASPAIAADGSVYTIVRPALVRSDPDSFLVAYPPP